MTAWQPGRPPLEASDLVFETPNLTAEEVAAATAVLVAAAEAQQPAAGGARDRGAAWRRSVHRQPRLAEPGPGAWVHQFLP